MLFNPFLNAILFRIKKHPVCSIALVSLRIKSTTWRLIKVITVLQSVALFFFCYSELEKLSSLLDVHGVDGVHGEVVV